MLKNKELKKKVLIIFGTRPEAIKMAPLIKEFRKYPDKFFVRVCVTAQHRYMLDQILDVFNITADFDLDIMKKNQNLYDVTTNVLLGMRKILKSFLPNIVLVQGDTTTALSASLAAFYERIKIGHIEAGLRTNNLSAPWPEEMNRQVVDRLSNYCFAPTLQSKENLIREGICKDNIFVTGNTVIDALLEMVSTINSNSSLRKSVIDSIKEAGCLLNRTIALNKKYILVTGHRRESFGEGFLCICQALKDIAQRYPKFDIVYPVHLNPNVQKPVYEILGHIKNIFLIPPLDYPSFVFLMQHCYLILTDSGGIQEEAPSLGKPVLVMRDITERSEAISAGTAMIVGTKVDKIAGSVIQLINDVDAYQKISIATNPYGDGTASKKIVDTLSCLL